MYGSSFCSVTRRPRSLSRRPSEDAVRPLPSELATPPVTKMCFGMTGPQRTARPGGERSGTVAGTIGFSRWLFERNGNAVASLLVALAGLPGFGIILGPIAVGLGLLARRNIDHEPAGQPGLGLAIASASLIGAGRRSSCRSSAR